MEETHEHEELVNERIQAHDEQPSAIKDLTMRSGAVGLRQLADVPPDTPVKLAMHFYAFEHLEIATYEFLIRIAEEAGDKDTVEAAKKILEQELKPEGEDDKEGEEEEGGEDDSEGKAEGEGDSKDEKEGEEEKQASSA